MRNFGAGAVMAPAPSLVRTDMDEKVLAYAAGLFDGEGSVIIAKSKNTYWLQSRVTNTDLRLLDFMKKHFGGFVCRQGKAGPNSGPRRTRECWYWAITSNNASAFLVMILPYLLAKGEQAEIAIEFQKRLSGTHGAHHIPAEELKVRESYKQRISCLNKTGKEEVLQTIFE